VVDGGLRDRVKLGASGKLVTAYDLCRAFAIGADYVMSARAFMFAIGCIQSRSRHSNHCPTGVATQDACVNARSSSRTRPSGSPIIAAAQLRSAGADAGLDGVERRSSG